MVVSPGTHVCCGPGWPLGSCCPCGTPPPPPAQLHRSRSQESRVLGEEGDLGSAAVAGVPPRASALLHQGRSWQTEGAPPVSPTCGWLWGHRLSVPLRLRGHARLFFLLNPRQELRFGEVAVCSRAKTGIRGEARLIWAPHNLSHAQPLPTKSSSPPLRRCADLGAHRNRQGDLRGHPLGFLTPPQKQPQGNPWGAWGVTV